MSHPQKKGKWFLGGWAGAVAATCTHPLDLMKVRMQVAKGLGGPLSASQIAVSIFKGEGIIGFYRGLTASILRQLSYSTLRFGVYDILKHRVTKNGQDIGFILQMSLACGAGAVGAFSGNPFDVVNIRMQSDFGLPPEKRRRYKNGLHGVWRTIQTEGITGCFTGLGPNVQRGFLISACQIVSYERSKGYLMKSLGFLDNPKTHFVASMMSGLVTVTITNPIDVVKTVVMSSARGTYKSGFHCAFVLVKSYGLLSLMKGWTPAYIRLGPFTIICFMVLEQLRKIPALQDDIIE